MIIQSIRERLLASTMIGSVALMAAVAVPAAAVMIMPAAAAAQDYSAGTLSGGVKTPDGDSISGATVTVLSNEQGQVRTAVTDANGNFRVPLIPIGAYTVTIGAPGYNTISQTASVRLGGESSFTFTLSTGEATDLAEVVVTGARQALDFNRTTTGLTVDLEELVKTLPVGRSLTAVTLLAPGTAQGDSAFGDLPSISGSSVAENAYFVNGLNVTNFANFLGGSTIPFDFYRSVEVKTGGYSAEFGRSTGGVVNTVTKSGSNDFKFALHGNWAPDSLREQAPDTFASRNALDEADSSNYTVELSGPIIKDRLFVYGLAEFRDSETRDSSITGRSTAVQTSDDPFYGVKVDGYITQDHRLEFTWFDTTRETVRDTYAFDPDSDVTGGYQSTTIGAFGGESWVARYTGTITDWMTISAAYGKNEDRDSTLQSSDVPYATDSRSGTTIRVSPDQAGSTNSVIELEREFFRADADFYFNLLGDHHVRVGYDKEKNSLLSVSVRPGPFQGAYQYRRAAPLVDGKSLTAMANGGNLLPGQDYLEVNIFNSGGAFEGENEAFYIQDEWDVTEQLTLNLGVRLDKFVLNNIVGDELTNFDKEIGPRLGFSYDPGNDGQSRVYGFFGRYFMPVAANTASRMGGQELYYSEYFLLPAGAGPDATGAPTAVGAQIVGWDDATVCPDGPGFGAAGVRGCRVTSTGELYDASTQIGQNLESTMEEEFILGYERKFGDLWSAGVSFTFRDLKRSAEDIAIDAAVLNYCDAEGIAGCDDIWTGFHQYVIHNPGNSLEVILSDPLPGETELRTVTLSANALGYPPIKRQYQALQFDFERAFDGLWTVQGSYTLSESRGNFEGYVKSDNGQDDAGATTDFDQPGLMDGADGLLPNHHAHTFKVFGSYQLTDNLLIGANAILQSPRAYGCIGVHPTDAFAGAYQDASWYCQGELTPRGSQFSGQWYRNVDVSLRYTLGDVLPVGNLVLRADVFNVFNFANATDFDEYGDLPSGAPNETYRQPLAYQTPRYVRLGFDLSF